MKNEINTTKQNKKYDISHTKRYKELIKDILYYNSIHNENNKMYNVSISRYYCTFEIDTYFDLADFFEEHDLTLLSIEAHNSVLYVTYMR